MESCNFVRIQKKLHVTPTMAAGVSDRLWEIADIARLVEVKGQAPKARGPYRRGLRADLNCFIKPNFAKRVLASVDIFHAVVPDQMPV